MTLLPWTSFLDIYKSLILFDFCKSKILDCKLTSYYCEELCYENHLTLKTLSAFRNTLKVGLPQSALFLLWLWDLSWYYWPLAFLYIQHASGDLYFSAFRISWLSSFIESVHFISSGFLNKSGNMAWGIMQESVFSRRATWNYWLLMKGEPVCICMYCIYIYTYYLCVYYICI